MTPADHASSHPDPCAGIPVPAKNQAPGRGSLSQCPPSDMAQAIAVRLRGLGVDTVDLRGDALLAWTECRQRWQPEFGATLRTQAFPAMCGRPRDHLRREHRHLRALRELRQLGPEASIQLDSTTLAVREVLQRVAPQFKTEEKMVLQQVYFADHSLRQTAEVTGMSEDSVWRAHQRLLQRLRRHLQEVVST